MPITKQELRKELRRRRLSLPIEDALQKERAIVSHIAASDAFRSADLVLLYAPIGSELNLLPLVRAARANGTPVAFPISRPDTCTLDFRILTPDARLMPGEYDIPEPPADAPRITPTARTLCVLPGLSFTPDGARIGYGKGYYDRFLATFPGIAVGAAYECMLCKKLPTDAHDMPVSAGIGEFLADSTRVEDILIPDDPRTAEADYALRINGDSMEPKYHSGDVILIQTTDTVEEGELGIFVLDGSGYFKRYGGDRLMSLNPKYPPIPLKDFEDVACCGRVVGKLKRK